jgi:hypothetical protein
MLTGHSTKFYAIAGLVAARRFPKNDIEGQIEVSAI